MHKDPDFAQLKVVELASILAGPAVGTFFAELGAQVIKIENKNTQGDLTRRWKTPQESPDELSAYYASVNYQKEVLLLDLKGDIDQVYGLIRDADIVISNFKKESALRLGINYERLRDINSQLIYGQVNGFESDPSRVAFDMVLQAESGFLSMTGEPNRPPSKMPVALIDVMAAHQLKQGILAALWKREKNNRGYYVSCSLEKTALTALVNQASNYLMTGLVAKPMGSLHPNIAPYGEVFQSKDGIGFILAVGAERQFQDLCNFLKLPIKEEYQTNTLRLKNRDQLAQDLKQSFLQLDFDVIFENAKSLKIPLGQIKKLDQVLEEPLAQSMVLDENIDGTDTKRLQTIAFRIAD